MAVTVGKSGIVKRGTDVIAELGGWSIEESSEPIERTVQGGGAYRTYVPSVTTWSGSITCYYDQADAAQTAFAVGAHFTAEFYPDDDMAADELWQGGIVVTGVGTEIADDINSLITRSIEFQGSGSLVKTEIGGTVTPVTPVGHMLKAAISLDDTLSQAEIDAGTSSTSAIATVPVWSGGRRWIFVGVQESEADITGIATGGIEVIHAWVRVTGIMDGYKWWSTINSQSDVASGVAYTITQ